MERVRGLGEGGEGGEDVELLDGWVSALEEGDRMVVVMLICNGFFVFIIFCSEFYNIAVIVQYTIKIRQTFLSNVNLYILIAFVILYCGFLLNNHETILK